MMLLNTSDGDERQTERKSRSAHHPRLEAKDRKQKAVQDSGNRLDVGTFMASRKITFHKAFQHRDGKQETICVGDVNGAKSDST